MKTRNRLWTCLLAVALLICASAGELSAQRTTAALTGTVSTDDGTTLNGAKAIVTNMETGFQRDTTTNEAGNYRFELPVGTYSLRVEFEPFQPIIYEPIKLSVADVREINVSLNPAIEDVITVTTERVLVETIGGEVSSLISGEEVRELPLNGRNFVQLTQLMPGVSSPDGIDFKNKGLLTGVDMSVSGSSVTANQWSVDGANNNDVGSNRTILVYPSTEAIEEFKIHRNSYGPEFGGAGGAQINVVTKSGTNQWRGSLFSYLRDDSLNEKNAFLERAGADKEKLSREDYGFTLGGPIIRDSVHFFTSTEWNDENRGTVRSAVVPTVAERNGDFSTPQPAGCESPVPIDPTTGAPFPGNVIPSDRLSPAGVELLKLYPAPNTTASSGSCNNWVAAVPTDIEWQQINARLDWSATESAQVLLRYTEDDWDNPAPNAGEANGLWGDDRFPAVDSGWNQPGESIVAQITNVFGRSGVNTFTFSRTGNEIDITRGPEGAALNSSINGLIPTVFPANEKTGGADRSHPVYWGGATGQDLWNIAPWNNDQDLMIFKNDYQQVFGEHWLKVGALYSDNSKDETCCGSSAFESPHFWGGAGIDPWGASSGNRIADILIKDMHHGFDESAFQPAPKLEWEDIEIYAGDSWSVSPTVTVDYGVRWSRFDAPAAAANNIAAFYPELWDETLGNDACNGIAQVPGTDPCGQQGLLGGGFGAGRGFVKDDTDNFAPRIGINWDMSGDGTSVLRAGFGTYFQRERVNVQLDFGGQPPFTENTFGLRRLDVAEVVSGGSGFGVPNRGINPNNVTPYNNQFNLTWERRLWRDASIEVSYVGNRGKHLLRKSDINQVPAGDANGNGVSDRLEFLRGGGDGNGGVRPFFDGGPNRILYWETNGSSEYDALQTQFQTRFGRGSLFQASYTYSKFDANDTLTSSSAGEEPSQITDRDNKSLDWGPAGLDRRHIFNMTGVYNLPSYEGEGGFKEYFLGDWAIGGVFAYASGSPITVYAIDIPGLGGAGFAGTGYDDNNRPLRVPGVSCGGSGAQVINPGAFTVEGLVLGDTSQMSRRGQCDGPDFFQLDLALYKNFRFGNRVDAQLRIEAFNVTNRVNYIGGSVENNMRPFNVEFDAPLGSATRIVGADIPGNFGQATAARDPRQFQLGLVLRF